MIGWSRRQVYKPQKKAPPFEQFVVKQVERAVELGQLEIRSADVQNIEPAPLHRGDSGAHLFNFDLRQFVDPMIVGGKVLWIPARRIDDGNVPVSVENVK